MTEWKCALSTRSIFSFFLAALLLGGPSAVMAYDIEFDAGGRIGSGRPSALGAFSWNASKISGAFAVGSTADGEVSVDTDRNAGIDANFRGDASLSFGPLVSGLRLEASAVRAAETSKESIDISLSAPFTLNGRDLSFSAAPLFGAGFYDNESVKFGANASLSYLAGELVLKPGAAVSWIWYPSGARTFEIMPAVGVVWYPGLPVTADFSAGWARSETEGGTVSTSFPVAAAFSVVPFPWLCVTAKYKSTGDVSGLMSYRVEGELELIHYNRDGNAFHLPVAAYYSWTDGGSAVFGTSVMVGFSFGQE